MEKYDSGRVLVSQSGILKLSGSASPLLTTSKSSVSYLGGVAVDREGEYVIAAYAPNVGKDGDKGNIFVMPSVYLTSYSVLVKPGASNKDFSYALLERLFGANTAPYGTSTVAYTSNVLNGLTMGRAKLYTAIIMSVPTVLVVVGTVTIIKRKNR